MSRSFVNVTWNNSAEQYDGYQQMNRHMNPNGTAAIHNYSDEALAKDKPKKKPSVSIQDRILPQQRRVITLTNQMKELVNEYQKGNIDIDEYSMLLSVISSKRSRAVELLEKAKSVRAPFESLEDDTRSDENELNCLGKAHVNSDKKGRTSKGSVIEGNRFKEACFPTENPKKSSNSHFLSKVADWINNHQFTYFVVCSTIALTAAKLIF